MQKRLTAKFLFYSIAAFLILISAASFSQAEEKFDRDVADQFELFSGRPEGFQASLVHEIFNFHVVSPGVMRGSQPSEEGFIMLKEYYNVRRI